MRLPRVALAALAATLSVGAAQSAVVPSPALNAPVKGWTAVAGMSGPEDVARHAAEGAHVVLVGEALVKDGDPASAVRALREASR